MYDELSCSWIVGLTVMRNTIYNFVPFKGAHFTQATCTQGRFEKETVHSKWFKLASCLLFKPVEEQSNKRATIGISNLFELGIQAPTVLDFIGRYTDPTFNCVHYL